MPENDPEQELGPKITAALQDHAGLTGLQKTGLAHEARRRVHKRRQTWSVAAAAVLVAAVAGGVWGVVGSESPVSNTKSDAGTAPAAVPSRNAEGLATSPVNTGCRPQAAITQAPSPNALPAGTGLDVNTPVTGLTACRYSMSNGAVLGQQVFDAAVAQQVVDAIKVLPERNPALPVFKCAPQVAKPSEAIALRFTTAAGIREIWVHYDGCMSPGFFTGTKVYGLYSAPLKLFMVGNVRPTRGTYLDALKDW
ncbi:hypothetical protein GCM10009630_39450 [Kribbella jejuensis]|uniref:Uncharacterized protein n=1 Tax=Kribbella jejuensis TaxID=236068 RepID=A0A542ERH7_9ACTN|nr:hypothetical protein [Kribbella jejuensis]TQJ17940.1 hypothetical protein FB475_2070 [Kribbella jejuensis]